MSQRQLLLDKLAASKDTNNPELRQVNWALVTGIFVIIPHKSNTQALLDAYGITVRHNEMTSEIEVQVGDTLYEVTPTDKFTMITDIARQHGYNGQGEIRGHLNLIAQDNSFHPVAQWLNAQKWDGKDRFEALLATIDSTNPALTRVLLYRWLIGGVTAIYQKDGFEGQGVLTFIGDQGVGKTRWFSNLMPHKKWFLDGVSVKPKNPHQVSKATNQWLSELGEIETTLNVRSLALLKAWITSSTDSRPAQKFTPTRTKPRRTFFGGSVNERTYLRDTENRRFWTIELNDINADHNININQLWAQFKHLYDNNERHWLSKRENNALRKHNVQYTEVYASRKKTTGNNRNAQ